MSTMDPSGVGWTDEDAGPIVRPYVMTSGRTRPARGTFDLISIVLATQQMSEKDVSGQPESARILRCCREPTSVAELASELDLPAGTIKVLLGDLLERKLIVTRPPRTGPHPADQPILKAVIDGLRTL